MFLFSLVYLLDANREIINNSTLRIAEENLTIIYFLRFLITFPDRQTLIRSIMTINFIYFII